MRNTIRDVLYSLMILAFVILAGVMSYKTDAHGTLVMLILAAACAGMYAVERHNA